MGPELIATTESTSRPRTFHAGSAKMTGSWSDSRAVLVGLGVRLALERG
jgi:hypothetical protein